MKIIACDPGESFGYCGGHDERLEFAGTVDMNEFSYTLAAVLGLIPDHVPVAPLDPTLQQRLTGVEQLVVEDWVLYPWAMEQGALNFDKCRTARVIGALELTAQIAGIPLKHQGAKIKETAQAAGVEDLYTKPLHENRHQNDAMQHYVFFNLQRGNPPVRWEKEGVAV